MNSMESTHLRVAVAPVTLVKVLPPPENFGFLMQLVNTLTSKGSVEHERVMTPSFCIVGHSLFQDRSLGISSRRGHISQHLDMVQEE